MSRLHRVCTARVMEKANLLLLHERDCHSRNIIRKTHLYTYDICKSIRERENRNNITYSLDGSQSEKGAKRPYCLPSRRGVTSRGHLKSESVQLVFEIVGWHKNENRRPAAYTLLSRQRSHL